MFAWVTWAEEELSQRPWEAGPARGPPTRPCACRGPWPASRALRVGAVGAVGGASPRARPHRPRGRPVRSGPDAPRMPRPDEPAGSPAGNRRGAGPALGWPGASRRPRWPVCGDPLPAVVRGSERAAGGGLGRDHELAEETLPPHTALPRAKPLLLFPAPTKPLSSGRAPDGGPDGGQKRLRAGLRPAPVPVRPGWGRAGRGGQASGGAWRGGGGAAINWLPRVAAPPRALPRAPASTLAMEQPVTGTRGNVSGGEQQRVGKCSEQRRGPSLYGGRWGRGAGVHCREVGVGRARCPPRGREARPLPPRVSPTWVGVSKGPPSNAVSLLQALTAAWSPTSRGHLGSS